MRNALAAMLADVLPQKIPLLRAAYGIDEGPLPDVDVVSSGEMPEQALTSIGDVWLEVVNPRLLPGLLRVDIDPAGYPVYRMRYACRVYVWAKGADWDEAMVRRDMITGATRMAMLEFPTLTTAGGDTGYLVHEDTYTEEFGVPQRVPNASGRCWATALCSVDMWSEESMAEGRMREPIGANNSTVITPEVYGPTAPFPDDAPSPEEIDANTEEISSGNP